VSGQVTPDSYVVDTEKMKFIDINVAEQEKMLIGKIPNPTVPVGRQESQIPNKSQIPNPKFQMISNKMVGVPKNKKSQQKLNNKQILELAKICLNIEKHYQKPQDIEWAFCDNKFYMVQSRPITTL
jgi:pyruvate,water dikinase